MKHYSLLMTIGLSLGASMALISCSNSNSAPASTSTSARTFSNFQAASVVIGQPTLTTAPAQPCPADFSAVNTQPTQNALPVTASTIWCPIGNPGLGSLYLPDAANNRVLVYPTVPTTNGAAATLVLGQTDFATTIPGGTATGMSRAQTSVVYGGKLLVVDTLNHRVLIWNTIPSSSSVAADVVVGQPDMSTVVPNCTASSLQKPESIAIVNGALVVVDTYNNRLLFWTTIPVTNGEPADYVLGQVNFDTCGATANLDETSLNLPYDVLSVGGGLAVADLSNHRVLIWNTVPSCTPDPCAITTPFNVVIGQPSVTSTLPNNPAISGATLYYPSYLATDGTRLALTDSYNHRVLIWNTVPTCTPTLPASNCAANTPANIVLGQPDFTSSAINNDGTGSSAVNAKGLYTPSGLAFISSSQLLVMDTFNNRVLVFNAQ